MTEPVDVAEDALERSQSLSDDEAAAVLRDARRTLEEASESRSDRDSERIATLADHLDLRLQEVGERDAYDGAYGAAVESDDENAP